MTHRKPRTRPCSHRIYQLSCEDYDQLVAEANYCCQLCQVPASETKHGHLVVDHDASLGDWAVRGILCSPCNTVAAVVGTKRPEVQAYLADPWWERTRGPMMPQDEPPIGSVVSIGPRRRRWARGAEGWRPLARYQSTRRTWYELNYQFGPHSIHAEPDGP